MFHLVAVHDADIDHISYETDRSRFIGPRQHPDPSRRSHPARTALQLGRIGPRPHRGDPLHPHLAARDDATIDMVVGIGIGATAATS